MLETDREEHDSFEKYHCGSPWIQQVRHAITSSQDDFFKVSPIRYWFDFLLSMTIAYTAAAIYLESPLWSWQQFIAFPIAAFWLYRLGSLVHEVCHLGQHEMRVFKVTWNVLVGVMTFMPSPFFTRHHRDHHTQRMYGTPEDPEYVANVFQRGNTFSFFLYCLHMLVFPLLVFLRFLLAPLTFVHPRLREVVLRRASSLTLNRNYQRHLTDFDRRVITAIEMLCFVRAAFIPFSIAFGLAHWSRIPLLYALGLVTFILNQMRQLADHHFDGNGERVDLESHILDSCNYTGNDPLTLLFFPFSIRFHALHHLFPSMPYHNLKRAHAHLVKTLPIENLYRTLDRPGWWSVSRVTVFPALATSLNSSDPDLSGHLAPVGISSTHQVSL